MEGQPIANSPHTWMFRMTEDIGIGVSRQSPHRLINSGGGSTPKTHVNKEVKGDRRVLVLWTRTEQPGEIAKRRQSLVSKKRSSHAYFSTELTT